MNSGLRTLLFLTLTLGLNAQSNSSLSGRWFVRHLQFTLDTTNKVTDARSLYGSATFTGSGNYTFIGQQVILTGAPASYSVSGTYNVAASGVVALTNPQRPALNLNARFNPEALSGATTEVADNTFDYFIAIPAPTSPTTSTANLTGTYYAADFELNTATATQVRNAWFAMTADGAGNVGPLSVRGHAANLAAGASVFQALTGASYGITSDGSGTITFPTPAGQSSQSALVGPTQKTLYISSTGNIILAASPTGHDLLIAVKAFSGTATPASLAPGLWSSGLRLDPTAGAASWTGSTRNTPTSLLRSRRLHETGAAPINETAALPFTLAADGTGSAAAARLGLGAGGKLLTAASVNTQFDPNGYEIGFLAATPTLTGNGVFLNPLGVVNAASGAPALDAIAPGEFIALYGTGLAASTLSALPPYPTTVNGVSVTIGGLPAPLQLVSSGQINCLVPYGVTGTTVAIAVNNKGTFSNTVQIPLAPTAPGIFTLDSSGTNDGATLHLNGTLVNAASPAKKGEIVAMYLTGLGALTPAIPDGQGATAANSAKTQLLLLINGTPVAATDLLYAGLSSLAGLYQINFRVPATLAVSGTVPIAILTPDAFHDQVTLAVQ